MHIAMVLLSRYPTKKAYGITTKYTVSALRSMGHHVEVFSPDNEHVYKAVPAGLVAKAINSKLLKFSNISILSKIQFLAISVVWLIVVKAYLKKKNFDLVWARHLLVPIWLSSTDSMFCELHSKPNLLLSWILNQTRKAGIHLGPISPFLMRYCEIKFGHRFPLIYSPMGAPDFFFKEIEKPFSFEKISLVYIGRFDSIGQDQGVSKFIENYLQVLSRSEKKMELSLLGISTKQLNEVALRLKTPLEALLNSNIRAIADIDHALVPSSLSDVNVSVLPYLDLSRFRGRFPIKAVEYAALGIPILCANSVFLKEIFNEDCVWFYDPSVSQSLLDALYSISANPALAMEKARRAQAFARNLDYGTRVNRIMDLVQLQH